MIRLFSCDLYGLTREKLTFFVQRHVNLVILFRIVDYREPDNSGLVFKERAPGKAANR
jgi:hypothetical protein